MTVLLTRNDERISGTFLNTINPIKQTYKKFTQGLEDKSHSYIFQKETIEKLSHENRILRKRLLEQMHYIDQVKNVYDVLPDLAKLPVENISIAETISYVKLNSFSQVLLTRPKNFEEKKIYGLIQGTVTAGVATIKNNQLHGYLTSDDKCRFSVFVGKSKAPGIAIGVSRNEMIVKFIPKWHKVKVGEKVVTSGMDKIFFTNIPVGVVTKVEVQSAYTVAYIKPYNNTLNPKTFFVVNNPKVTILENFDSNTTKLNFDCPKETNRDFQIYKEFEDDSNESNISKVDVNSSTKEEYKRVELNETIPIISSIPARLEQTRDDVVDPEIPTENAVKPVVKKQKVKQKVKKPAHKKKYIPPKSLDLF
ncbi:Rod shape-determining protein MreC [hydrothermal vent metagenome]|uniref:Rod shape-determining protein MreC n=1 Tax=hydrothermal vent metagenome TaxID=652676 RepID=A0A1W1EET3_9ZZZZ